MSNVERDAGIDVTERGLHDPLQVEQERKDRADARSSRLAGLVREDRIHPEEIENLPRFDAPPASG